MDDTNNKAPEAQVTAPTEPVAEAAPAVETVNHTSETANVQAPEAVQTVSVDAAQTPVATAETAGTPPSAPAPTDPRALEQLSVIKHLQAFRNLTESNLRLKEHHRLLALEQKTPASFVRRWNTESNNYFVLGVKIKRRMLRAHKNLKTIKQQKPAA